MKAARVLTGVGLAMAYLTVVILAWFALILHLVTGRHRD